MYDMIGDGYDYLRPKGAVTVEFDEKYNIYDLNFSLDILNKEIIRLWLSGIRSPSPCISSSEYESQECECHRSLDLLKTEKMSGTIFGLVIDL